jgi:hypothetical protein
VLQAGSPACVILNAEVMAFIERKGLLLAQGRQRSREQT